MLGYCKEWLPSRLSKVLYCSLFKKAILFNLVQWNIQLMRKVKYGREREKNSGR